MSETTAAIPAPKRSKRTLIIAASAALVLLIGGGGAAFWWSQRASAQTVTEPEAAPEPEADGIVTFEPFVVNLADPGVSRFLRVKVQLLVASEGEAAEIQESAVKVSRARAIVLELLTTQKSDVLITAEGKAALRKSIRDSISGALHFEVIDVLFSDFVVQF